VVGADCDEWWLSGKAVIFYWVYYGQGRMPLMKGEYSGVVKTLCREGLMGTAGIMSLGEGEHLSTGEKFLLFPPHVQSRQQQPFTSVSGRKYF
jgi:hypothetical protein